MKRWFLLGGVFVIGLPAALLLKGYPVNKSAPFYMVPFQDFEEGAQEFQRGFGDESFQIQVPMGEKIDEISFVNESIRRERIPLDNYGVGTSYTIAKVNQGFYLFQGSGVLFFNQDGTKKFWREAMDSQSSFSSLNGPVYPAFDGSLIAFLSYSAPSNDAEINKLELVRFHPEEGRRETLLSLPEETEHGRLERIDLPNGFIATRWTVPGNLGEAAQFYGLDGKPQVHPLATAINTLHKHQIDLRPGAFYPSQTNDPWGLFPWDSMPGYLDKRLFLLSVTDTVQAVPVTCERYSLEPQESLTFVLVNPKLNLFLLGARLHRNDDRIMIYLGRVRKDSMGKIYRAETFRVKYFPEVESPIFSRNGQVLLFASRISNQTNLVFARLEDIVADVNRRYPDAKFDLEELR